MKITRKKETVNGQQVVKIQPSLLMFRVYYDYVNQKRIKDFKENDTKTEPFNKDKKGQIELYCGLKKGFLYKDNKVSIIQNSDNADMETLRKLIEDYLNGDQIFISYENKTTNGYYCIYADCSGLNFYEDYYLTDNPEIEDETESVYIDNEKANILKELALKSSFEIEMSDEITETDNEYFATFNEGKIQSKDKKIWKSINVNGLGDFYVPESQQLLKKDFLDWKTFKEINNKAKNKIEFDFQTVDKDLEINIDYSKVADKLGLKNISEASYNLLIKILTNNDSVDIFNSESSDDLVKDSANKILNAFYNGKFIHPLECDSTLYNEDIKELINVSDENYDKQKNSINMFSKMKKVLKENLFAFYNPICFLDKLDKAGLFEFNPYEGKSGTDLNGNAWQCIDNPGFAPYDASYFGTKFNGYASTINVTFNVPLNGKNHAGIDLDGARDFSTPIHSLIFATVIGSGYHSEWGNYVVLQNNKDTTLFYILAHLHKIIINTGVVVPKMVIGYVGNTGNCWSTCGNKYTKSIRVDTSPKDLADGWGRHLHLQVVKEPNSNSKKIYNNGILTGMNTIAVNPFKHNEPWVK